MGRAETLFLAKSIVGNEVQSLVQAGLALGAVVLRLVTKKEVDEETEVPRGPEPALELVAEAEDGLGPHERVGDLVGREQLAMNGVHDLLRVALPEPGLALPD